MASVPKSHLTPEEYLAQERKATFKSEYVNGEVFAMAGASLSHARIVRNLMKELSAKLSDECELFVSDLRLEVSSDHLFTYPDVMVVCGDVKLRDDEGLDTLLNPIVIFEVLSPSTANYDKGGKFDHYKNVASLREYVLLAQDKIHVEIRERQPGSQWLTTDYHGKDKKVLMLKSIGVVIEIASMYDKVL